jgi:hypothetical protein
MRMPRALIFRQLNAEINLRFGITLLSEKRQFVPTFV